MFWLIFVIATTVFTAIFMFRKNKDSIMPILVTTLSFCMSILISIIGILVIDTIFTLAQSPLTAETTITELTPIDNHNNYLYISPSGEFKISTITLSSLTEVRQTLETPCLKQINYKFSNPILKFFVPFSTKTKTTIYIPPNSIRIGDFYET